MGTFMRRCLLGFALLVVLTSCDDDDPAGPAISPAKPYLGETPPGRTPVVFAPQFVSTPDYTEYSGCLSHDGTEYYFYRFSATSMSQVLCTRAENGTWTQPEQVPVTTGFPAFEPFITVDDERLFFIWNRTPKGYYCSQRADTGWSEPQFAGLGMYMTSDDAGHLYTTDVSERSTTGRTYLARVTFDNGTFTAYERLNISPYYGTQAHPCIARDGSYIVFDIDGGSHMFVSFKNQDDSWGDAIDLAQHGFDINAGGAYISPDGKYLFFFLNNDIWWVDIGVVEDLRPGG